MMGFVKSIRIPRSRKAMLLGGASLLLLLGGAGAGYYFIAGGSGDHGHEEMAAEAEAEVDAELVQVVPVVEEPVHDPLDNVRALQMALLQTQDRLLAGDGSAVALQAQLQTQIGEELRLALSEHMGDEVDLGPLFAYALSGGQSRLALAMLERVPESHGDHAAATAIAAYLRGNGETATEGFSQIDAEQLDFPAGALLSIAQGTAAIHVDPERSVDLFLQVALQAPGTLMEDTALRRVLQLAAELGRAPLYYELLSDYALRFSRSPFAPSLWRSVPDQVTLFGDTDPPDFTQQFTSLPDRQRQWLLETISRNALTAGHSHLALAAIEALPQGEPKPDLYRAMAMVQQNDPDDAARLAASVASDDLDDVDRSLLDATIAATGLLTEVRRPDGPARAEPAVPADAEAPEGLGAPAIQTQPVSATGAEIQAGAIAADADLGAGSNMGGEFETEEDRFARSAADSIPPSPVENRIDDLSARLSKTLDDAQTSLERSDHD